MDPSQLPPQLKSLPELSIQVDVYIDPSNVEKFLDAFNGIMALVTQEPECVYFEVFRDPMDPGHVWWLENWKQTAEWLMTVQIPKDYYKPYFELTEPMFVKPREFKVSQRLGKPFVYQSEENVGPVLK